MGRLARWQIFALRIWERRGFDDREAMVRCFMLYGYADCLVLKPIDLMLERGYLVEAESGKIGITEKGRSALKRIQERGG